VWYYSPAKVSGILLGYVPLEEYTFFVLEAFLVGLAWQLLEPRQVPAHPFQQGARLRLLAAICSIALWIGSMLVLLSGWRPGIYLGLILAWVLPPITIQLAFGADILWQHRKPLATLILIPALYLCAADAAAIQNGIWAIDPAQSTQLFVGSLPLEEGLFFVATVILLAFGMTLSLAEQSALRYRALRRRLRL
jgi:lycopene cyclase domain-containing protein